MGFLGVFSDNNKNASMLFFTPQALSQWTVVHGKECKGLPMGRTRPKH